VGDVEGTAQVDSEELDLGRRSGLSTSSSSARMTRTTMCARDLRQLKIGELRR
jgi:hypothetical protein